MTKPITPQQAEGRALPEIGRDFYASPVGLIGPAGAFARNLLGLSDGVSASWWKRHGWRLGPAGKIGRLLLLHRLAFEAELEGVTRRADFFWTEAHTALRRSWRRIVDWEEVRASLAAGARPTAQELRHLVARELFLDAHAAFANGRLQAGTPLPPDDRAFVHFAFIRDLVRLCAMPGEQAAALLAPCLEAETEALERAGQWDRAISCAASTLEAAPEEKALQDRVVGLRFRGALAKLANKEDLAGANVLEAAIGPLEGFRRTYPGNTLAYDALSRLHRLRAVRLANGGRVSDALPAARRAQLYDPSDRAADETMEQLAELMRRTQDRMREIEGELRRSGNASLNSNGLRLKAEAQRGFGPLEDYMRTAEPAEIAEARRLAHAETLRREIGLAQPDDPVQAKTRALALLGIVSSAFGSDASTREEIAGALRAQDAAAEILTDADLPGAADFILARRAGQAGNAGSAAGGDAPRSEAGQQPAAIPPPAATRPGLEPFGYWLFGSQDTGIRALAAAAAALVLLVGGATLLDARGSAARAEAFAGLREAAARDDAEAVPAEAERFRAAWTVRPRDWRNETVERLGREAADAPRRRLRDAAADRLRSALASGDRDAALAAAEDFLGAAPEQGQDPRLGTVLDLYAREFSHWFAENPDRSGPPAEARIERYRRLTGAARSAEATP